MNFEEFKKKYDSIKFNFPFPKFNIKEDCYEVEYPIEMFDGWQVHDEESGEFLGWVNAKNHTIEKYTIKVEEKNENID